METKDCVLEEDLNALRGALSEEVAKTLNAIRSEYYPYNNSIVAFLAIFRETTGAECNSNLKPITGLGLRDVAATIASLETLLISRLAEARWKLSLREYNGGSGESHLTLVWDKIRGIDDTLFIGNQAECGIIVISNKNRTCYSV